MPVIGGGGIECFELQLSEHEVGEVACPSVSLGSLNSCLCGGTQAKAILVLYLLEVAGVLLHIF